MVVHAFNVSASEAEEGRYHELEVSLHKETQSEKVSKIPHRNFRCSSAPSTAAVVYDYGAKEQSGG